MSDVVLRGIRKSFGKLEILHGIDLEIKDGEFVVFVGPSGCGKSTLLRAIAGLEDITAGELRIGGKPCNDVPPSKRGIAMVFQSYALYPHMTVAENMAFGLKLAGMDKLQMKAAVDRAARILRIESLLDRKPKELSGGQRQRVAIGRAIVRKPEVFLFDEPLSNLDAALRVQMRIEITKLHRDLNTTMIYVTHDQVEAMTLADRIIVMSDGNVEQVGSPLELYHHPSNLFVAGFIGSPKMNFIEGKLVAASAETATVELADGSVIEANVDARKGVAGAKVTVGIRPEHWRFNINGNTIDGEVIASEHLGESTVLFLQAQGALEHLVVRADATHDAEVGERISVHLPPDRCYLFNEAGTAFRRVRTLELHTAAV
jgi:ABC-type sugar transport system ATPase subunit